MNYVNRGRLKGRKESCPREVEREEPDGGMWGGGVSLHLHYDPRWKSDNAFVDIFECIFLMISPFFNECNFLH